MTLSSSLFVGVLFSLPRESWHSPTSLTFPIGGSFTGVVQIETVLGQLSKGLRLTEDEATGVDVPAEAQDMELPRLCLVGRLLSQKPYNFEGLSRSVQGMLN
ncbi:hypothetical protein Salat_2797100 [Sesamum alatum]|uniref:Uncharacterized protein n=1 Tax=Sesamum alatum TaxID=300844 RepID=A0AAE1XL31_9LAMI|nr:hypothetical protein Salat_2797100 [Sesamum alatum]